MAASQLAISACSTDFLHIVLNTAGHVKVNDTLDVALINTHTESDSAAEAADLVVNELLLDVRPLLVGLTSMIRRRFYTLLVQHLGYLVSGSPLSRKDEYRVNVFELG